MSYPLRDSRQLKLPKIPASPPCAMALANLQDAVPAGNLLIMGKRDATDRAGKLEDRLCEFDTQMSFLASFTFEPNRCGIRLLRDNNGYVCQLNANANTGLLRLSDGTVLLRSGTATVLHDPRYNQQAQIYIGIQDQGEDSFGRPVLDACFDSAGYLYIVPVVVDVAGHEPYLAGAKLQLRLGLTPPFAIIQIYDNPPLPGDNQDRGGLREIKVDNSSHVYMVNAYRDNSSDRIEMYGTNGAYIKKKDLASGGTIISDPIAVCLANNYTSIYLASGQNAPDANSTKVYRLSASDFNSIETISIHNMGHVTSITEDANSHCVWVAGFTMANIPRANEIPDGPFQPFYHPSLAKINPGQSVVDAVSLSQSVSGLALPTSIVWVGNGGTPKCGGANLDNDQNVDFGDFAFVSKYWRKSGCVLSNYCNGTDMNKDGVVNFKDFGVMAQQWLATSCL